MGYDKELLKFLKNGANDDLAIDILGSLRTLHEMQQVHAKSTRRSLAVQNGKRQKEMDKLTIDRVSSTKDRERERRKHRRDVDLRYMKTMRNLRDRFKSAYLCNKRHCLPLQERLELHKMEKHSSDKGSCRTQCETQTIGILKKPSQQTELVLTENKDCSYSSVGERDSQRAMASTSECITTSPSLKQCIPSKSGITLNSKRSVETECMEVHISHCTSPYNIKRNKIDNSTSFDKHKRYYDTMNQCHIDDERPSTSKSISKCCNTQYTEFNNIPKTNKRNVPSKFDNSTICATDKLFHKDKNNRPKLLKSMENLNTDGENIKNEKYNESDNLDDCNCSIELLPTGHKVDSFCNNELSTIKMTKTNEVNKNVNIELNNFKSDKQKCSEASTTKRDNIYNNQNDIPRRKTYKYSRHSVKSSQNVETHKSPRSYSCDTENCNNDVNCTETFDRKKYFITDIISINEIVNSDGSHTKSARRRKSCSTDKPRKSVSDKSVLTRSDEALRRLESGIVSDDPIRGAVKEWIQELPLFPGFGRESQEEIDIVINDLIQNLQDLSTQNDRLDDEQRVKEKIDNSLKKLPIWYPGAKRDQFIFKNDLIKRLLIHLSKIKPLNDQKRDGNVRICTESDIQNSKTTYNDDIKNEISEWLQTIQLKNDCDGINCNIDHILDSMCIQTSPLLNKSISNKNIKIILVSTIVNILNDLPININCPKKRLLYVHKFSEDLANKLLSIQVNYCNRSKNTNTPTASHARNITNGTDSSDDYYQRAVICSAVRKCFEDENINCHNLVIEETGLIIVDFIEMPDPEGENYAKNEMINLLVTSTNMSEAQASGIAKHILRKVKNMITEGRIHIRCCHKFIPSKNISIYTSIEESSSMNYPITSTPKKKVEKKYISKLNPQQIQYINQVSNLIRAWIDTLPESFSAPEKKDFKETVIEDLAYDIMDDAKLEQLTTRNKSLKKKYLDYYVRRWLWRLNAFELEEVNAHIEELVNRIHDIPVPLLTEPQHGNRQEMANIKFREIGSWEKPFLPKGSDILEDQISMWMNEQPSHIFSDGIKTSRNKEIHELAQTLENKLKNKHPANEISNEVGKWLNNVVKPENKYEIAVLAENLKDRVIDLPQDATLAAYIDKKLKLKEKSENDLAKYVETKENRLQHVNNEKSRNESAEQEHTMKMFLSKYIEHNYDIDDPIARRAFNQLLKTHLQRLNPSTRKEVYDNLGRSRTEEKFPPHNLIKELEYIKDISDWLKNLPLEASYNTLGNRDRIDFVNSLAMNIREVEDEKEINPNAMDYNSYMASIIHESLRQLPILKEYINIHNNNFMTNQLLYKIEAHRQTVMNRTKLNESIDTTGVNTDNIGDLIEEFIQINGDDIAQDEVKLEAWAIRLIREIKKMVQDTSRPSVLSKIYVYNKLTTVPIPGDETADLFSLELEYVKEISHWIKNLPLLPISKEEENDRVRKICELGEKITEIDKKAAEGLNNETINKEFQDYLTKWISELPLDRSREIVLPIVIKQLIKRIENVKRNDRFPGLNYTQLNLSKQVIPESTSSNVKKIKSSSNKSRNRDKKPHNTKNLIIDVIEGWSNTLPFNRENEQDSQNIKDDISRKLFQKVGQLNMDARIYNDDLLYREMLIDEIDKIFEYVPQNTKLLNHKDKSKYDIANAILEAKNIMKDKKAGDTYKLKLENTIEASIPHPLNVKHYYDPGFEIYKNRLATMFILDNFDHGPDVVKLKYEHLLRKEIDKYFEHATHLQNTVPLTKDESQNELYSALFKVPIPNEAAIAEEVEELKTRCEIDAWFEELPLKDADGLDELLKWDRILSTMAKKIREIEIEEPNPDQKMFREIMKWLAKLPVQTAYKSELEQFAERLQNTLKSTAHQRKYIFDDIKNLKDKKGKGKVKNKKSNIQNKVTEVNQIADSISTNHIEMKPYYIPEFRNPTKKAADLIFETVQTWCDQLPVCADSPSEKMNTEQLKDNLTTQIVIKISNLNMNPVFFNDNDLYDELLDEELEKLLSTFPTTCNFEKSKPSRKYQLKEAIKSIKPLILEERANHIYKETLNKTVDKILEMPQNTTPEKKDLYVELRNDIVDDFLQYKFNIDDDKSRQTYKTNMNNTVTEFINNIVENNDKINSLIKTNQLISELKKIPVTHKLNDREDVEEIRMKKEISDFLDHLDIKEVDGTKLHYLKANLAKKLNEIEMKGHAPKNELKMKHEITRFFKKLGKQVSLDHIDGFITKLKNNENIRRAPQRRRLKKCQNDCKGVRHTLNRKNEDISAIHIPLCCKPGTVPNVPLRSTDDDLLVNKFQYTDAKVYNTVIARGPNQKNSDVDAEISGDRSLSEDENKSPLKCPYDNRKYKRCRGRPYCMVPMRWICEGCDGYNPFWCRMPLPGFM